MKKSRTKKKALDWRGEPESIIQFDLFVYLAYAVLLKLGEFNTPKHGFKFSFVKLRDFVVGLCTKYMLGRQHHRLDISLVVR